MAKGNKMTMSQWEKSAKDQKMDKEALAKHNAKAKPKSKGK